MFGIGNLRRMRGRDMPPPPKENQSYQDGDEEIKTVELPIIIDGDDWFYQTDWEYANKGIKEGWLTLIGWHRSADNTIWYRYLFKGE